MKLSLVASTLLAAGIVFPPVWFLALVGLALFFVTLRSSSTQPLGAAASGLVFGIVSGAASTVWFLETIPLNFLGIESTTTQVIAVGMTWLYVALSLAAPVPVGALVVWLCRRSMWFPIIASVVWSLTELGRMWCFALTTYGPQSLFGPHFSAAAIGYALTENHLVLQLADPWGLDALNFAAGFLAGVLSIAPAFYRLKEFWLRLGIQGLAIGGAWLFFAAPTPSPTQQESAQSLRFAIVSENLDSVRDESTHSIVRENLSSALAAQPPVDVVVLPEELGLTSIFWSRDEYRTFVQRYTGERELLIVGTRNELFPADEKNQFAESKKLVYESTRRGEVGRYVKQMLMPLGEYAPSFAKTFFSVIPDPSLQSYVQEVAVPSLAPTSTLTLGEFRGVRLGGLLCSDLFSPYLYRTLVRGHGAQVLINSANHFWFHGSRFLYWKTLQMARLHAVQNRLPFLLANNVAPSFAIDSSGRLLSESRWGMRGVMYVDLSL